MAIGILMTNLQNAANIAMNHMTLQTQPLELFKKKKKILHTPA